MLILASQSPRRQELLRNAGFRFRVNPAGVDEAPLPSEDPHNYVQRLARDKAEAVAGHFPADVVIGADTSVLVDGEILGKPRNADDAARMLRLLSGRAHEVVTGIAVVANGKSEIAVESTAVHFVSLTDEEIAGYIATGEPMDKAGAYAIQGIASRWIPRIEGDYFNVVGLPIARLTRMLARIGTTQAP